VLAGRLAIGVVLAVLSSRGVAAQLPDVGYDSTASLAVEERLDRDLGFARIMEVSYASPRGGRVPALVVVPANATTAGIVWQHWGQGDRSSLLPDALALARVGAVSILINAPWFRASPSDRVTEEQDTWLVSVVDIRRAVDLLVSRYGVRPPRVGYVGHSYGATLGGLVIAAERRFGAAVLMGGFSRLSEEAEVPATGTPEQRAEAKRALAARLAVIDADRYIGHAAPTAVFLQFARFDRFITKAQADRYAAAASEPKLVRWYDTGHEFNDLASIHDRGSWLARRLNLPGYDERFRRLVDSTARSAAR
jgi:dienelactone hydrolase